MKARSLVWVMLLVVLVFSVACAAPTLAPASTAAPPVAVQRPAASSSSSAASSAALPSNAPSSANENSPVTALTAQRKIIKNAQFVLTVESTPTALDRLTGITTDMGGYVVSTRVFTENGLRAATISFAVPVDRFEETLRRVRALALKVESESASGQDVTDQYVDLESQLRNLQATADRIRGFLAKAQTVDEALKVSQQLSQVEKDIETIKGKMNYIEGRADFSTITVELREPRPTPTPTVPPTPTLTPTPVGWYPDRTLKQAVDTQSTLLKALVDLTIWLAVVFLPYVIAFVVFAYIVIRVARRLSKKPAPTSKPPEST